MHLENCPSRPADADTPTRADGSGDGLPDVQQAAEGGIALADMMGALNDETAPVEKRQQSIMQGAQVVGGLFARSVERKAHREEAAKDEARNVDLEQREDVPSCDCGYQFGSISPQAETVSCPECGAEFHVVR